MITLTKKNFLEKLKIGGIWHKVLFPYVFKERVDLDGQYDFDLGEIRIAGVDKGGGERTLDFIVISLIHEMLHAVDNTSGHRLFFENEKALEGISRGIFQVLVDNGFLKLED